MPVRVIQWATGAVGLLQLQEIIEHPDLELAGVLVYDPAKAGQDAGELCGLGPTGVLATADKEAVFATPADVVLHAASKAQPGAVDANTDDIVRLLASGRSVITTTSYAHLPTFGAEVQGRIEKACAEGGSRFFAAGENPGFMLERLAVTLTGLSQHVDRIVLTETTDVSRLTSRPMLIDFMGMGKDPAEITVEGRVFQGIGLAYRQALNATADALGITLDEIVPGVEALTLDHDLVVAAGTIAAGTVAAQRMSWSGIWRGREFLRIEELWVLTRDLPAWGLKPGPDEPLIRITVEGRPTLRLTLDTKLETDLPHLAGANGGHLMIAMTGARAIPAVLAAPPGVLTAPVFGALTPWR